MATAIWMMCIFVAASIANSHKQKAVSNEPMKNSTFTRNFYLTQQHILQHTRWYFGVDFDYKYGTCLFYNAILFVSTFKRHHNLVTNKSKVMKHDDLQMATIRSQFDESNQQENSIKPIPITKFPLKNIPLYHAHYHQHNQYNASDLPHASLRNRSAIRKRASAEEKQISTNISMVLEGLLKYGS